MSKLTKYKFSDLYEMSSGISSSKQQAGHGSPFISFSTVFNNYFLPEELPDLMDTSLKEQEIFSVKKDDVFITRTSETVDALAMSCVAVKDYPKATFSGFVKRLRPKTTGIVYSKYIAFFLRSKYFRKVLDCNTIMTLRASFNEDMFSFLYLYLPDYEEQVRIGDLLYKMEMKIRTNNKINDNLEQQILSIYHYLFTQFDFPDEVGNPYCSSGGKMMQNDILKRNIPITWKVKTLGELCSFQNGINYDKGIIGDKDYRIINVRNISSSSILLDENELDIISLPHKKGDKYCVTDDSIIIARSGIPGATRILFKPTTNTIFCGFIICCTPTDKELQYYLTFYLKLLEGSSATQTGGSILQNVSQDTLSSLPVPIPPKMLLDEFNQTVLQTFELIHTNMNETSQLINLRDWLLPMLMNGQATIND
ncbi:TPA: restriction endonuclease subunit S [Enterococcus faecium]|jgi:type I restriction enzyme S subunit|nr:restriction endonuclease subunit S [Enterococcus faecium]